MAKAEFYVYVHRRVDTGEVFYVGKGSGPRYKDRRGRNRHWHCVERGRGFVAEIVISGLQEWAAFEIEADLIALYGRNDIGYGPLTNTSDGGEGASGTIFTDAMRAVISNRQRGDGNVSKRSDVRAKLSAAFIGDGNPTKRADVRSKLSQGMLGKKLSAETREKMSQAKRGKVFSPETRAKIAATKMGDKHPLFGKRLDDEYRRKISETLKRKFAEARSQA